MEWLGLLLFAGATTFFVGRYFTRRADQEEAEREQASPEDPR